MSKDVDITGFLRIYCQTDNKKAVIMEFTDIAIF